VIVIHVSEKGVVRVELLTSKQGRQRRYKVIVRGIPVTIVAVEKQ